MSADRHRLFHYQTFVNLLGGNTIMSNKRVTVLLSMALVLALLLSACTVAPPQALPLRKRNRLLLKRPDPSKSVW